MFLHPLTLITLLLVSSGSIQIVLAQQPSATYDIVFDATWSSTTHPDAGFPFDPHFSAPVGAIHNNLVSFWSTGNIASVGIERMAEDGLTQPLLDEINAAISSGNAFTSFLIGGIDSPDSITISDVTVTADYPLVTLVTMIAPSPDWFTGVSGLSLLDQQGNWVTTKTVMLYPYDAGTEQGNAYSTVNPPTVPQEPIRGISGSAPFSTAPVGTLTFVRTDINNNDLAAITSPAPDSTLSGSTVTFTWTNVGADQYWLEIGATPNSAEYFGGDQGTATSATISGLPTDGSPIYARLWTIRNFSWQVQTFAFTASSSGNGGGGNPQFAEIVDPPPNSSLSSSTTTFSWTDVGADQYWLEVGATLGNAEYFGGDQGTNTSATITNLPTDGSIVYVRLWTIQGFSWSFQDFQFATGSTGGGSGSGPAEILTPQPNTTLSGSTVTFTWTDVGADQYWLEVGATFGNAEYFGGDQGTATTATVTGLPTDGSTIHVRLWTIKNSVWTANTFQFTAAQ